MNKKIVIFIVFVSILLLNGQVSPARAEKNPVPESVIAAETFNIDGLWTISIIRTAAGVTIECNAIILGDENKLIFALSKNWGVDSYGFSGNCIVTADNIEITAGEDIIFSAVGKAMNADYMSGTWSLSDDSDSGTWTADRNSLPPSPDFDVRGMWMWAHEEEDFPFPFAWPMIFSGQKDAGKCKFMDLISDFFKIIFPEGAYTVSDDQVTITFTYETGQTDITGKIVNGGLMEGTYSYDNSHGVGTGPWVALLVALPGKNPPFGAFETPQDGASISGSIAVTGWALAGRGVEKVEIFLLDNGNPVYIGDTLFIEGARPDIEAAYPNYPMNKKAGWGYMLLTNFLPGGGNGTYVLEAVATDYVGNAQSLGTKTIYCDNANAVKPFGAIDAPGPGQKVSGSQYKNNGWVLTPPPDSIPETGTTINVYIDNVYLGHPAYGIYRPDIEALFGPEYTNRSAAGGSFTLDTTAFENGLHIIYWTARDSGGDEEGIGSRYFVIDNSSGSADRPAHRIFGKKMNHLFEDNRLKAFEFDIKPKSELPSK